LKSLLIKKSSLAKSPLQLRLENPGKKDKEAEDLSEKQKVAEVRRQKTINSKKEKAQQICF